MKTFALSDLVQLLEECGERDASVEAVVEANAESNFEDLGYDSLALFNVAVRIEEQFGIRLEYDLMIGARTPKALLGLIRDRLSS